MSSAYLWLVLSLAIPFLLLYGLGRLSRWHAGRSDPIASGACRCGHEHEDGQRCQACACLASQPLIGTPRWCKDKAGYWNEVDQQKVNRAGEKTWQDALRAQRKARQVPKPQPRAKNVLPMVQGKRRA